MMGGVLQPPMQAEAACRGGTHMQLQQPFLVSQLVVWSSICIYIASAICCFACADAHAWPAAAKATLALGYC